MAAVAVFGLADEIAVIGSLPRGLPSFELPLVETSDLPSLSAAAIGIALVAFADTSVLSRTFASRLGRDVNPNHEVIALGLANAATGLFQGFPISSSASRTPVAESAGARTQLTGLVGAAVIAIVLVAAPSLFADLPQAALGGIVIVAATSLIEIRGVIRLARVRSPEFWLSVACFMGVAILGVLPGIFLSIGLALGQFVHRAWRPHDAVLGRSPGFKGYHDVTRHPEGQEIPGLLSPLGRTAVLRQRGPVPGPGDALRSPHGAASSMDRRGGRADHRCRCHRSRGAEGAPGRA